MSSSAATFVRVLAEFWADGPNSESRRAIGTRWRNAVSDHPNFCEALSAETGPVLDDLEWDVKMYFVVNAAVCRDAACAVVGGSKRYYDAWRPIGAVRYMATLGSIRPIPNCTTIQSQLACR
jgi:hypothetical protein